MAPKEVMKSPFGPLRNKFFLFLPMQTPKRHTVTSHLCPQMNMLVPKAIAVETISSAKFLCMRTSSLPTVYSLFGM